uniref:diguanylate cyclase n=2 Tax=Leptospirillum ferriphilum TaxID=178606 RepID=A0A2I2MGL2_9BACT
MKAMGGNFHMMSPVDYLLSKPPILEDLDTVLGEIDKIREAHDLFMKDVRFNLEYPEYISQLDVEKAMEMLAWFDEWKRILSDRKLGFTRIVDEIRESYIELVQYISHLVDSSLASRTEMGETEESCRTKISGLLQSSLQSGEPVSPEKFDALVSDLLHLAMQPKRIEKLKGVQEHRRIFGHTLNPYEGMDGRFLTLLTELKSAILDTQGSIDFLTGLPNRRYLNETIPHLRRHGDKSCVLLLDIDHFKKINDTFGHPVGDMVLREIADLLRSNVRSNEKILPFRLGGEEFVLISSTDLQGSRTLAERIRQTIERHFEHGFNRDGKRYPDLKVTVSIGVSSHEVFGQEDPSLSFRKAIESADEALYQAKKNGRNRVVTKTEIQKKFSESHPRKPKNI